MGHNVTRVTVYRNLPKLVGTVYRRIRWNVRRPVFRYPRYCSLHIYISIMFTHTCAYRHARIHVHVYVSLMSLDKTSPVNTRVNLVTNCRRVMCVCAYTRSALGQTAGEFQCVLNSSRRQMVKNHIVYLSTRASSVRTHCRTYDVTRARARGVKNNDKRA